MKIVRRILLIIVSIIVIALAVGFIFPRKIHVERTLLLSASQKTIYSQVNSLKNWGRWSPWLLSDTSIQLVTSGPESGNGATLKWMSRDKNVGTGSLKIISSFAPDSIEVVFDFADKGKSTAKIYFRKENQNTNVLFCLESDLGLNPVSRWFGLFADRLIGPDIEMGLFNLDQLVQDTKNIYGYEIIDYEVPARILISVRDTASPETITPKLTSMYKHISLLLKSKNISPIGNPVAIFHNFSNNYFDIEAGLPVSSVVEVPEGLYCIQKDAERTVMIKYSGSYKLIASAYKAIQTYIYNNDLETNGPGWEEYNTNPTIDTDSDTRQTTIYYPVK